MHEEKWISAFRLPNLTNRVSAHEQVDDFFLRTRFDGMMLISVSSFSSEIDANQHVAQRKDI